MMWHYQILDFLTKKQEIKSILKTDLVKIVNSEMSYEEISKRLESQEFQEEIKGKFNLKEISKFKSCLAAIQKFPLNWLYQKAETNMANSVFKEYIESSSIKSPRKEVQEGVDLEELVKTKGNAKTLKKKLKKQAKKLVEERAQSIEEEKTMYRMPSIQDLVIERDRAVNLMIAAGRNKVSMNNSEVALFKNSVIKKVQMQNFLDHFEFKIDQKFLITAIVTFIDHFISKPKEFAMINLEIQK